MSNKQSSTNNNQNPILTIDEQIRKELNDSSDRKQFEKYNRSISNKIISRTERIRAYFTTNEGRIALVDLFFTLICVILQHIMGTCYHSVSDGSKVIKWYVFTPPFGAGPHTAVFFFVLSWITLVYCIERIWVYLTTSAPIANQRDLIVRGIIVILYFLAFGFNIWGYVLCESTSQVNESKIFTPGVCRGDSQACIPLIAGVMISFATGCAFLSEHILALMKLWRNHRDSKQPTPSRILP